MFSLSPIFQVFGTSHVARCLRVFTQTSLVTLLLSLFLSGNVASAQPTAATLYSPYTYYNSQVQLSWTQSYDGDFTSYKIYRGTSPGVTEANGTLVDTLTSNYYVYYSDSTATASIAPGTTYYYRVAVTTSTGTALSNEQSITLVDDPPYPVSINYLYGGYYGGGTYLNWIRSYISDFASYKVYRGTSAGVTPENGTLLATLTNADNTYYTDSTATASTPPGATYYYIVVVTDTAGQATPSTEQSVTLVDNPPSAVTLNVYNGGYYSSGTYLSWSQCNESDFASYKVYRGTSSGVTPQNGTLLTTITNSQSTYYSDNTATATTPPGTTYYYIVVVTDAAGQATPSTEQSITLVNNPPSAVTINYIYTGYDSHPSLSWSRSYESDFAAYKVYRGTSAGVTPENGTLLTTITSADSTYYTDEGATQSVAPGTTYYYIVVVTDTADQSTPSEEKSITLVDNPPSAVSLNLYNNYYGSGAYLYWNQSYESDFAAYKVYRGTSPGVTPQNGTLLTTLTNSQSTYYYDETAVATLPPGTTYYYIVCVVDTAGQSTASQEQNLLMVNAAPMAVSINYIYSYYNSHPYISWTQSYESDFASYKVYRGTAPGVTPENGTLLATITNSQNTSYYDESAVATPSPGTTYYYIVVVTDTVGQATHSEEKSITLIDDNPTPTPTVEPIATPTSASTATPEPTATRTGDPTATPEPTATAIPTAIPTAAPIATPTEGPTPTPTVAPTPSPIDARIRTSTTTSWTGENIVNTTAQDQTVTQNTSAGETATFFVAVKRNSGESGQTVRLKADGAGETATFSVGEGSQQQDITETITGNGGWTTQIASGQETVIKIEIAVRVGTEEDIAPIFVTASDDDTSETPPTDKVCASVSTSSLQPDVSLERLNSDGASEESVGSGIFNDDAQQTLSSIAIPGQTQTYLAHIENASQSATTFRVTLGGPLGGNGAATLWQPEGWTMVATHDSDGQLLDVTKALLGAQGWTTPSIAPGEEIVVKLTATAPASSPLPSGTFRLVAAKGSLKDAAVASLATQSIAHLEWSRDGQTWSQQPLTAEKNEVIAFRAVPDNSAVAWDDLPDFNPVWTEQGVTHWGETVWIHFPVLGTKTISAQCGNTKTFSVQVVESPQ